MAESCDLIHLFGGNSTSTYTAHYKWNGISWVEDTKLPYNFGYADAIVYDNEIHISYQTYPLGGTFGNHHKDNLPLHISHSWQHPLAKAIRTSH